NGARAAGIPTPTLLDALDAASGSTAVLWGVLAALAVAAGLAGGSRVLALGTLTDLLFRGAGAMLPIATLLVLAFGIGAICDTLGTGPFIADLVTPYLTPVLLAPLVFVTSGAIAFATGTSWGTFAIMIPLALPVAAAMALDGSTVSVPLVVSAVLGGGVFGDHCSPISDTSLISSMAAWSDHIDHVRTQFPYALLAGAASVVLYLVAGVFII
ncbi:MAG: Na+/H+ antiporter NhaC family protein, partial [Acidobacteriota bacterium]|nr:Na+/H+ antiporter NhaC family protein [Acidobacteriota bacterium]